MERDNSNRLFKRAQNYIPGGVNSPVRAFKSVGGDPLFIKSAKGAYLMDVDGNKFIDLINSWGPMILGHANETIEEAVKEAIGRSLSFGAPSPAEVEMAELIVELMPSIEKVRMVNSGTEATMSAIRLARGYTGREKIIKFDGNYHGHGDSFLIAAGSGAITMGVPDSPGVTKGTAQDTLIAKFNNLDSVIDLLSENKDDVAAIIVEPVAGNMGCVPPNPGFLYGLRQLCDQYGAVLIFDEVMTGFRVSRGGAQELYNVKPDLTTLGKIIGGGMPVGAYGGKKEIMNQIAPLGPVYQAGTLSGNPVAMAAGIAMLKHLKNNPSTYFKINSITDHIVKGIRLNIIKLGLPMTVNQEGSMFSLFFTKGPVTDFDSAKRSDLNLFSSYFRSMLNKGIYLAPSQYETLFVSSAIEEIEADLIIQSNYDALNEIANGL
jgi:glutamate-1-semialdehyde 2,1-aminomutase